MSEFLMGDPTEVELEQLRREVDAIVDTVRHLAGSIPLPLLTVGQAAGLNRALVALLDLRKEF